MLVWGTAPGVAGRGGRCASRGAQKPLKIRSAKKREWSRWPGGSSRWRGGRGGDRATAGGCATRGWGQPCHGPGYGGIGAWGPPRAEPPTRPRAPLSCWGARGSAGRRHPPRDPQGRGKGGSQLRGGARGAAAPGGPGAPRVRDPGGQPRPGVGVGVSGKNVPAVPHHGGIPSPWRPGGNSAAIVWRRGPVPAAPGLSPRGGGSGPCSRPRPLPRAGGRGRRAPARVGPGGAGAEPHACRCPAGRGRAGGGRDLRCSPRLQRPPPGAGAAGRAGGDSAAGAPGTCRRGGARWAALGRAGSQLSR